MATACARAGNMSPFPPGLPEDLDNPTAISDHDWQAFRQISAMQDHWQRPGWTSGRRSYHWMLIFPDADDVRKLAGTCQRRLPSTGLDLVPLDALHLTLGRIAFTDEISGSTATEVAQEARSRCRALAPLTLAVGPLAGSMGAIRFSVAPWSELFVLHRRLTTATRRVIGNCAVTTIENFRPHVSIAYANASLPVGAFLPTMEQLRRLPSAAATLSEATLVELRREDHTYRYEVVDRVVLG